MADALSGLDYVVSVLTPGTTSLDGECQILACAAENTALNAQWADISPVIMEYA